MDDPVKRISFKRKHQHMRVVVHDHKGGKFVALFLEMLDCAHYDSSLFEFEKRLILCQSPGDEIHGARHTPMRKRSPVDCEFGCFHPLWHVAVDGALGRQDASPTNLCELGAEAFPENRSGVIGLDGKFLNQRQCYPGGFFYVSRALFDEIVFFEVFLAFVGTEVAFGKVSAVGGAEDSFESMQQFSDRIVSPQHRFLR